MYNWTEKRLSTEFNSRLKSLSEDENPSYGGNINLNEKATYAVFTAATDMTVNTLCYMNSAGKMAKASATSEALANTLLGVSAAGYSEDDEGYFYLFGVVSLSGFRPGVILYASTELGLIQDDAPMGSSEIIRVVGYGLPDNKIYFNPDRTWLELEA